MKDKTIDDYMALPYKILIIPDEDCGYFIQLPELPGCMSQGDTIEEAVEMIRDAQRLIIEYLLESKQNISLPESMTGV